MCVSCGYWRNLPSSSIGIGGSMPSRLSHAALTLALLSSAGVACAADPVFNRIASFPVTSNLPAGKDGKTATSAEIVPASKDGKVLIYSDSPLGAIGFVDIADAKAPKALGALSFDGEPTS